ncbi:hypothetical protein BU15DRAFT_82089 [Melanogaster broomeanus]|nr:hypothetical protein BU15DRAFT_82089 [Melanogaster broomeanus]
MPTASADVHPQGHGENHFRALLKSLDGTTGGRKRKRSDPLDTYTSAARFFPLNFDPFVDFRSVLRNGISAEYEEQGGPRYDQEIGADAEAYEIQLYNDWVKTVPGFSDVIIKFETDPDALDEFIDAMTRRATKPPKGRIHGLQEPNIRNIMYAAVQIYFILSNEESRTTVTGTVDLTDMYYTVVDMIERKSDERWVKDLMQF